MKFLKKNHKLIILILIVLFLIKFVQSCTREEQNEKIKENKNQVIDSIKISKNQEIFHLNDSISMLDDSVKLLNFRVKLYKEKATAAERRAIAVQSTAEKIKSHTTVSIEREPDDTTSKKKKNNQEN